jgi:predicted GNAT family acetyltransferase
MATPIAMAEDRACVGGVWTPPELRGQGFARAVVAGQLMILAREGVRRGVLFTGEDNITAQRAYRALGFAELGPWGTTFYR